MQNVSTRFVASNGIRLAYDTFGADDAEAILLISGLGAQMIRWSVTFCEALASHGFRVIRHDNRDCGRSTHFTNSPVPDFGTLAATIARGHRPDVPYGLDDMAADVIGLLDALSIARAHVVGRSMGGMIAQILASAYRDRILSLTAIMSSTGNPSLPQASPEIMTLMTGPAPDPITDKSRYLSRRLAFARAIAGAGTPFDEDAHRALILEELCHGYNPAGTARQIAAMAATGDLRGRLANVTAPTLVIHGGDDRLIHPDCGCDIAASIAGADLKILEGMGHDLPPSFETTVIDAIIEHVSRRRI